MTTHPDRSLLFLPAIFAMLLLSVIAPAQSFRTDESVPTLETVLDRNGKVRQGVVGGFNATGFDMRLGRDGAPHFVPTGAHRARKQELSPEGGGAQMCRVDWDSRFYNSGAYDESFYHYASIAAIAVDASGNIFIGGRFSQIGDVVSSNIARYSTVTDTWSAMPNGGLSPMYNFSPDIFVKAMAIKGNDLYVGGKFSRSTDGSISTLTNIARYDIAGDSWHPVTGNGIGNPFTNTEVRALVVAGNDLFVGGSFAQTSDGSTINLHNIARYNLTINAWFALAGEGLSGEWVNALAVNGTDLYVGGFIQETWDSTVQNLNNLARYDFSNSTWHSVTGNGLNGEVSALLVNNGEMYVGGTFTQTFNGAIVNLGNIARYNLGIQAWTPFAHNGLNGEVRSFAVSSSGNELFVGGQFGQSADGSVTGLHHLARYDLTTITWSQFPGNGVDRNTVDAMLRVGNDLWIGGYFTQTFDGSTKNINSLARIDVTTNTWRPIGAAGIGLESEIKSLAVDAIGNVYVGGYFAQTASGIQINLNGIARYNSSTNTWSGLAGNGVNGGVFAIAISGNNLFIGGDFTQTADGSVTGLNRIAKYDLTTNIWSPLTNNGLTGAYVSALTIDSGVLYVGGSFSQTNGGATTNLNNIARYDIAGNAWSALSHNGLNSQVNALLVSGPYLFAGGNFTATHDNVIMALNKIARYDTTSGSWTTLDGFGLNGDVYALAVSGPELFVGGSFSATSDGTTPNLNRLGRYAMATNLWNTFSRGGLNGTVYSIAARNDKLYIGGAFTSTADFIHFSNHVAGYDTTTNEWSGHTMGSGFGFNTIETDADVYAVQLSGTDLIIGGLFTRVANCGVARFLTRHYLQHWTVPARPGALTSDDWFDPANWSAGIVPPPNSNLVISQGAGNINIASADVVLNDLVGNGGNITIAAGRTLTINGVLTLRGVVFNGGGTIVITSCKPEAIALGDATTYIQTTLLRCANTSGTFNFPVGTSNGPSPVSIKDLAGTGNISVRSNQGTYTGPANGLPTNRLARWWQIENPGGGITNADLYFNYPQADIAGNEYGYRAYRIAGGNASMMPGSINWFSNTALAQNVTGFSDWTLAEFAPSAANLSVGGRVVTASGNGIDKAIVTLTNQGGDVRRVITNSFGYYRFDEVEAGQTYVLTVSNKRVQFAEPTRVITVSDDAVDIDFVALK